MSAIEPDVLTIPQLAARWQVSRATLYRRIAAGTLPMFEPSPNVTRIRMEVVRAIERGEPPPDTLDAQPQPRRLR